MRELVGRIEILPSIGGISIPFFDVRSAKALLIALIPRPATKKNLAFLLGGIKTNYIRFFARVLISLEEFDIYLTPIVLSLVSIHGAIQ